MGNKLGWKIGIFSTLERGMQCKRPTIILGLAFLALLALIACGSGDSAGSPTESPTTAAPSTEVSLFEELLGTIPDTPNTRMSVMINDYAAAREILGVPLPGPEAEESTLFEYQRGVLGPAHMARSPFFNVRLGDAIWQPTRKHVAFDARNVDQSVQAGIVPKILEVARGRFDPDATAAALAACAECPPPDMESYGDVSFFSWGEDLAGDFRNRDKPPLFDMLGRGGRLAISIEYVFRTVETPGMKGLIDSKSGDGPSLADADEFRLLAHAMSDLDAYAAFFSDQTHRVSTVPDDTLNYGKLPEIQERLVGEIGKSTLLPRRSRFIHGVGLGPQQRGISRRKRTTAGEAGPGKHRSSSLDGGFGSVHIKSGRTCPISNAPGRRPS